MIQIHIKRKLVDGKVIRILECKDLRVMMDYVRQYYFKQKGWVIQEKAHTVGIFRKRYRTVLRKS
jgi:hypothetical protein